MPRRGIPQQDPEERRLRILSSIVYQLRGRVAQEIEEFLLHLPEKERILLSELLALECESPE